MASAWAAPSPGAEEFPLRQTKQSRDDLPPEQVVYRQNAFDDHGFNRVVRNVAVPTLTLYRAAKPAHDGAVLVICPGGGYEYVVIDREGAQLARYFQAQGLSVVVLKYRLPGPPPKPGEGYPRPQEDALEALREVRRRAEEWGIAAKRVGILGCSAGGHLAGSTAVLGSAEEGSRPDFVALLYPVVFMDGPWVHAGSRKNLLGEAPSKELCDAYSLERRARHGMPPFFLVHAKDDKAVPFQNSERLAEELRGAGVPVELMLVKQGGHGFALGRGAESARWPAAFLKWLDELP
jgi:acetyl esterase/lipase